MKRKINLPPSLSTVPGQSDAELEKEKILNRLGQIMRGLTPRRGSVADPANAAWYLYNIFCLAKAAKRQKEKGGLGQPC